MTHPSAFKARQPRSLMRRWRDLPIRLKLALAFMLMVALSIAFVGYLVDLRASAELRENVGINLNNRVETRAQVLGDWLQQESDELTALSFSFVHELREINAGFAGDEAAQARVEALRGDQTDSELIPPPSRNKEILEAFINSSPEHIAVM